MLACANLFLFKSQPSGPTPVNQDPHVPPAARRISNTKGNTSIKHVPGPKAA